MAYIPKSQIKANQFTPGNEWFYIKDNSEYTGFYYLISNGRAFTGKDQNSPPNDEIVQQTFIAPIPEVKNYETDDGGNLIEYVENYDGFTYGNQTQNGEDIRYYSILKDTDYSLYRASPIYNPVVPTLEDYEKGVFTRYFTCKINQLEYLEVSKLTYNNINDRNGAWAWEDYIPFTINWYIMGDIDRVFKNNNGGIFLAEKEIKRKGLKEYLGNKNLQYFKYEEKTNLSTMGGELITPGGQDYIGSYHIHPVQGPMEGATHRLLPHRKLFYKRFYETTVIDDLNQSGTIMLDEVQNIEYQASLLTNPEFNPLSKEDSSITQNTTFNTNSSVGGGY